MQSLIRVIYPAQCVACDAGTEDDFGLCGACWRDTDFISGTICDKCGVPLPGDFVDADVYCDDCMTIARPWDRGRAVLAYAGVGRKLVLQLKHGDRTDLAQPAGRWLARQAKDLIRPDTVIVPVPLHWVRLLRRRFNQAAIMANVLGKLLDVPVCPDALVRPRPTRSLDHRSRDARFATLQGAIKPHPKRASEIAGRSVLLVDDVMTSGATLAACADACVAAGANHVDVLTLARAVKDA